MSIISIVSLSFCYYAAAQASKARELKSSHVKESGICWEKVTSWDELIKKASKENKYIFLDCYATWCGPCITMDKVVFTNDSVKQFMDSNFVSFKVQINRTSNDLEQIRNLYSLASKLEEKYTIESFPTFLYFSPKGEPLHKVTGYRNPQEFIAASASARISDRQYYTILKKFNRGELVNEQLKRYAEEFSFSKEEFSWKAAYKYVKSLSSDQIRLRNNILFMIYFRESPQVAKVAVGYVKNLKQKELLKDENLLLVECLKDSASVQKKVTDYLNEVEKIELKDRCKLLRMFKGQKSFEGVAKKYINSLSKSDVLKRENLEVINDFTTSSRERGFKLFFRNQVKIDSILGYKDYTRNLIEFVIEQEEVQPYFINDNNRNEIPWSRIYDNIKSKYGVEIAEKILSNSKVRYYQYFTKKYNKGWSEYIKYYVEKVERYGTDTTDSYADATKLNNFAYSVIFKHSDNKEYLNTAIKWMEGVIRRSPREATFYDTYANLLFKIGRTSEAIFHQTKAVTIGKEENDDWCLPSLIDNLNKMNAGIQTW